MGAGRYVTIANFLCLAGIARSVKAKRKMLCTFKRSVE